MKFWLYKRLAQVEIDDEDFPLIQGFNWRLGDDGYARAKDYRNQKTIFMHSFLIETPKGLFTDHINGNRLDNRRSNLRFATYSQNNSNRRHSNLSGYKGISPLKSGRWIARCGRKYLGSFNTIEEAAEVYNQAARNMQGEFAVLNIIAK